MRCLPNERLRVGPNLKLVRSLLSAATTMLNLVTEVTDENSNPAQPLALCRVLLSRPGRDGT